MKKTFTTLFLLFLVTKLSFGQPIQTAKMLYNQGDYGRALELFEMIDSPEAYLFSGKSHFALNNFLKAANWLDKVTPASGSEVYQDAKYTQALAYFQLKDFTTALELTHELSTLPTTSITRSADLLYNDIIGFLTPKQLFEVFKQVKTEEIRLDLLEYSNGKLEYHALATLYKLYEESALTPSLRSNQIKTILQDSVGYWERYNPNFVRKAPKGMIYNIGVALPVFDFETSQYEIPQHLYMGIQLAIEEFNSSNGDKKAFINYANTSDRESAAIMSDFVFNKNVDVILGPLFSQKAKEFAVIAEEYQVPLVLPLANADTLDLYNNYTFQLNPTFSSQGKRMANYAVNVLGYDTLGVIAEKGSLGAPAAQAFMHEAERNGAFIEYYFEENFEDLGYDISDYTKFFTTDTLDSVAMVQAVYAPFTGTIAPTLIESMLTDLEAMRSKVDILGSEEWQNVDLEPRRLDSTELYFTRSFSIEASTSKADKFGSAFRLRFQTEPNQFAYIGYDAAYLVLKQLEWAKNPAYLRESLRGVRRYHGLSMDVDFNGSHVNRAVDIIHMSRKAAESDDVILINDQRRRRR